MVSDRLAFNLGEQGAVAPLFLVGHEDLLQPLRPAAALTFVDLTLAFVPPLVLHSHVRAPCAVAQVDGREAISGTGILYGQPAFASFDVASNGSFGDSWLLREFGPKHETGEWSSDPMHSVAYLARRANGTVTDVVTVSQLYFTSLYWSFTMLMKSPHIGPDTWIEKLFACLMVCTHAPCQPTPRTRAISCPEERVER